MADFNYGDIIEYNDGTYDVNFNDAKLWAAEHDTTFEELVNMRNLPKRYFKIGSNQYPKKMEDDEGVMVGVRSVRNDYLAKTDYTQLPDSPFDEETKKKYAEYRVFLRDFTKQDRWWEKEVLEFKDWSHIEEV